MIGIWLLGCALQGQMAGVVRVSEGAEVHLDAMTGESYELALRGEAAWLRDLDGVSVWVEGPRVGRMVWVGDWRVVTGADGSAPYLGLLRRHGGNLVLEDRNSGARYVFDADSFRDLESAAGKIVLVSGFVVGPHTLRVVDWRVVDTKVR